MALTLVDCACAARVHGDGSGIEIDYCDVHAAAPELLAALRIVNDVLARGADFQLGPKGTHRGFDTHVASLIAKAEGRA
jgi:hypothetical protein